MNVPTFRQTKFLLTAFIITMATVMAFASLVMAWIGKEPFLDATSWWGIAGSILALYGGSHITDTHLQQKKQVAPGDQQT
jgi:hypothetical protein